MPFPYVEGRQNPRKIAEMVRKVETLMLSYGGRPHLSKLISMTPAEMKTVYPALMQFQRVRRQLDPQNIFYTQRLAKLFG